MITPFHGLFIVLRLGLNIINLSTKFEVSKFTHYEDTKGNAKCRNWDGFRLGVTQGHQQDNPIRWSAYNFLFNLNRNIL